MTGRINLTPEAERQLTEIDPRSHRRAPVFPLSGRARDDVRPGMRTTTYEKRTLVVYEVDESSGEIVVNVAGVFHGGQNWEAALSADDDSEEAEARSCAESRCGAVCATATSQPHERRFVGRRLGPVKVVVLTGAGISAESGLPTFRDADGLWEGHDPMVVATPESYAADPDLVHRFYDERRAALGRVEPNAAHRALARLEEHLADDVLVVTQNVDDLHERAGSRRVVHLHGRLRSAWCTACDVRRAWTGSLGDRPACPACGERALRPDVVWFGEVPHGMADVERALWDCDVFVSIGTSGVVFPAAAFVHWAHKARTLELNLDPSAGSGDFDESRQGPATVLVPAWVDQVLGG